MNRLPVYLLALFSVLTSLPARAQTGDPCPHSFENPHPAILATAGLVLGIGEYFLGVGQHEGSHALAALMMGGKVEKIWILPEKMPDGHVRFGYTQYRGDFTPGQEAFTLLAPKITDLAILAGYAALVESDRLPDHKFLQLPLLVLAVGSWIDFSKDLPMTYKGQDIVRVYDLAGAHTEAQRVPFRILHGTLAAASLIPLIQGGIKLFTPLRSPAKLDSRNTQAPETLTARPFIGPGMLGVEGTF